jgi:membrane protease subunit HflK
VYSAYAAAPEVTRQRMYIDTVEQIMRESQKIILDTKGGNGGNMIYLPLDKLLERSSAARAGAGVAAQGSQIEELPAVTIDGRSRGVR